MGEERHRPSPAPGNRRDQVARAGPRRPGGVVLADLDAELGQLGAGVVRIARSSPVRLGDLAVPHEPLEQPLVAHALRPSASSAAATASASAWLMKV